MQTSSSTSTKAALIQAAQRLIAEKGLGTVSVKDITLAAGAKNPSAVHYHFGNVEALIKEVFSQRYHQIELERAKRLAEISADDSRRRILVLMEAAIEPFLRTCLDEEGRLYVRFCLQVSSDPRFSLAELVGTGGMGTLLFLQQEFAKCLPHLSMEMLNARLRQVFSISLLQGIDYARSIEAGTALPLDRVVRESAVTLTAYLSAEVE